MSTYIADFTAKIVGERKRLEALVGVQKAALIIDSCQVQHSLIFIEQAMKTGQLDLLRMLMKQVLPTLAGQVHVMTCIALADEKLTLGAEDVQAAEAERVSKIVGDAMKEVSLALGASLRGLTQ